MGIDLHRCSDAGVSDGFGEGGQIEIRVVLVFDIVVGHIGVSKSVDGDIMSQTDLLADFMVRLVGAGADTAAKGEVR